MDFSSYMFNLILQSANSIIITNKFLFLMIAQVIVYNQ